MQPSIDLVMICGRRPSLLARTLASFGEKMFAHFRFANVIANIDPFMGDQAAGDDCENLLRTAFPPEVAQLHIFRPETAGFAAAVQRAWRATTSDYVFHMEDDWTARGELTPQPFFDLLSADDVQAVTLVCATKHTRGLPQQTYRRITRSPRGYILKDELINAFSTSPGMFKGPFLRKAAELLDTRFDPEKQFFKGLNPALEELALPYRCMFLRGAQERDAIDDIGRDYRDQLGLKKLLIDGQAVWEPIAPE